MSEGAVSQSAAALGPVGLGADRNDMIGTRPAGRRREDRIVAASAAAKVLKDPKASKEAKTAAASALTQKMAKKK